MWPLYILEWRDQDPETTAWGFAKDQEAFSVWLRQARAGKAMDQQRLEIPYGYKY